MVSPPVAASLDNVNTNKLETAVSHVGSTDALGGEYYFAITIIRDDGQTNYETYPKSFAPLIHSQAAGNQTSNAVLMSDKKVCSVIYSVEDLQADILCADVIGDSHTRREYSTASEFNVSRDYAVIVHGTNANSTINGNELLTPYGMLGLESTPVLLWPPEYQDAAFYNGDYNGDGVDDVTILQNPSVHFLTGSSINHGCYEQKNCTTKVIIDPCVEQTWLMNTTAEVRVTIFDVDGDNLSSRVTLYYNDVNQQRSNYSLNRTTGTTIPFTINKDNKDFTANKTGNDYSLLVEIRDVVKPWQVQELEWSFAVSPTAGVVKGDCKTIITLDSGTAGTTSGPVLDDTSLDDNSVKNFLDEWTGLTGFGTSMLWFIIVVIAALAMMGGALANGGSVNAALAGGFSVAGLLSVMGVFLGFFGVVYIVLIGMIALGAVAIMFSRAWFGQGGG